MKFIKNNFGFTLLKFMFALVIFAITLAAIIPPLHHMFEPSKTNKPHQVIIEKSEEAKKIFNKYKPEIDKFIKHAKDVGDKVIKDIKGESKSQTDENAEKNIDVKEEMRPNDGAKKEMKINVQENSQAESIKNNMNVERFEPIEPIK